jgi:hypothetical protein
MTVPVNERTRHGVLAAPRIDSLDVAAILAELEQGELVRLPEFGPKIGMGEQARKYAIREGLIDATPGRCRSEGYSVTRDEAVTLLLAAVLAIAAGVAVAVTLRGMKGAGLTGAAAAAALAALPR